MLEVLTERRNKLHQELQNAKQSMDLLTEQLERAKIQFHVVNGHFNECSWQLNEAQNALHAEQARAAQAPECEPVKECNNGEVIEQEQSEAAEI